MNTQNEFYYASNSSRLLRILDWLTNVQFSEITNNKEDLQLILQLMSNDNPTFCQASFYLRMKLLLIENKREERLKTYLENKSGLIKEIGLNLPVEISKYLDDLISRIENKDIDFLAALLSNLPSEKK